jgi:hypothetical protein
MAYGDFVTSVGEEVGIVRNSRYGGFLTSRFGTVTKINGHGHIYVQSGDQEFRFNRRGNPYKDNFGPSLCHAAQLRAELARDGQRKERARIAREIEQKLKEGWSYSGTFHASEERIGNIKSLIADLELLVDH